MRPSSLRAVSLAGPIGMKRWILAILIALAALAAVVLIAGLNQIRLDALQEPGEVETFLATAVKQFLVRRSSREGIPPPPSNVQESIAEGDKLYATDCSMCHGSDGHTPTDSGRWMFPRASDLTSPAVQQYSDIELFWIIKNGIRLSGMPAFGRVESDEHIWNLAHYVRTLRGSAPAETAADRR
jgi:mono/diheme cytochrome c family protein